MFFTFQIKTNKGCSLNILKRTVYIVNNSSYAFVNEICVETRTTVFKLQSNDKEEQSNDVTAISK